MPTGVREKELREEGFLFVAGVDEAGAGALAGPVVAAAVVLPEGHELGVRDSKTLSEKQRERLIEEIEAVAVGVGIGFAHVDQIDSDGIRSANLRAMERAVEALESVDYLLVDAHKLSNTSIKQEAIIRGDSQEHCIAAASIVAKVTRDRFMKDAHAMYPIYGFDKHKGYGTKAHREVVVAEGRCPLHRTSFTIAV